MRTCISNKFSCDVDVLCIFPTTFQKPCQSDMYLVFYIAFLEMKFSTFSYFLVIFISFPEKCLFVYFAFLWHCSYFFLLICKNFLHMKDIGSICSHAENIFPSLELVFRFCGSFHPLSLPLSLPSFLLSSFLPSFLSTYGGSIF